MHTFDFGLWSFEGRLTRMIEVLKASVRVFEEGFRRSSG